MNLSKSRILNEKNFKILEIFGLLVALTLAAVFRFINISIYPGWYSDEGTIINITQNLLKGKLQYLALIDSTLLAARLPLFPLSLAVLFRLFGEGINTLRIYTSTLGMISVALLYFVVRKALGRDGVLLALLSAFMLAIFPLAVTYNRLGFSYNLLTPLVLLAFLGLWEFMRTLKHGWLALAAFVIGLGSVSDLMMVTFVLPFFFIVLLTRWKDLIWSLPLLGFPLIVYGTIMVLQNPNVFLYDLTFMISRLGEIPWWAQIPFVTFNTGELILSNTWFGIAIIGLFILIPPRFKYFSLLFFLLPLFSLGRTIGISGLGLYYISPLFPFVAIGIANLVVVGAPKILTTTRQGIDQAIEKFSALFKIQVFNWMSKRFNAVISSLVLFFLFQMRRMPRPVVGDEFASNAKNAPTCGRG